MTISIDEILASKLRFEANVYNVEGRKAKETLKNCKWEVKNLCGSDGFATAYHRGRFKRIYIDKSGIPIFQPSQILEIYPKPYKFISEFTDTDIDALKVKTGQMLLSCSGTIGKVSIVTDKLNEQVFSHDLIRINSLNKNEIGYIYTYLLSDIGNTILITNNYGAVIKHIEPEHLENVPIPNPSKEINKRKNS
jgi:type I restriction enzyme S subunit